MPIWLDSDQDPQFVGISGRASVGMELGRPHMVSLHCRRSSTIDFGYMMFIHLNRTVAISHALAMRLWARLDRNEAASPLFETATPVNEQLFLRVKGEVVEEKAGLSYIPASATYVPRYMSRARSSSAILTIDCS